MKIEIWNEGKIKYRRDSLNDDVVIEALNQPNYTVLVDGKKLTLSDVSGSLPLLELGIFYEIWCDSHTEEEASAKLETFMERQLGEEVANKIKSGERWRQ